MNEEVIIFVDNRSLGQSTAGWNMCGISDKVRKLSLMSNYERSYSEH